MTGELTKIEYSSEKPKLVSRSALERIKDQLLAPMLTNRPTVSTYPRKLDVELFDSDDRAQNEIDHVGRT
ncbi:hypothetical protein H8B02_05285 [Bradyrhizobium sp. Pear77]|uniref:hypothetical protein n=1 Tax=Bradyrhizobium altum TaxID=1571202 RepID=UPI001E3F15A7|nr:hypothetical protein [Bradyrhizobium altum]MCC8952896.1 hypothetical protein [Bradyrhizobium altum]